MNTNVEASGLITITQSDNRTLVWFAVVAFLTLQLALSGCRQDTKNQDARDQEAQDPVATKPSTSERLVESQRLFDQGDLRSASTVVQEILVREPDNVQAIRLAARVFVGREEDDQALSLLDEASSRLAEHEFELLSQAVAILQDRGQLVEASQRLERLVTLRPSDPTVLRAAAAAMNQQGYRFDANEHLRALARLVPLLPDELRSLLSPSDSYVSVPANLDLKSPNVIRSPLVMNLVRELYSQDDLRRSRSLLMKTPAMEQRRPAVMAYYGLLLLESQQYDDLAAWISKADKSWQRYPEHWLAVGGLALERRKFPLAIRSFQEAIVREPCDQTAIHRLAQALEANGDKTAAAAFRERGEDVKGLDELTGDIVRQPQIAPAAFNIVSRELRKIGLDFQAYSWELLSRQRGGFAGQEVQDDARTRRQLTANVDQAAMNARRLCGMSFDMYSTDYSVLLASSDSDSIRIDVSPSLGAKFVNVAEQTHLRFQYQNADPAVERHFLLHQALGAGIACLDYDLDGRVDLYVAQGAVNPPAETGARPNLLARNLGDTFEDTTLVAGCDDRGYSMGLTAGDWNQDGFADLVVGNMGRNRLLINQGDGSFRQQPGDAVWDDPKYTTGLAISDVTGDHLPEIIEVNYTDDDRIFQAIQFAPDGSPMRLPGPLQFDASVDRLFASVGDGSFQGREMKSDGQSMRRYGMGMVVTDIDGDGDNEILVGNDQTANNLWDPVANSAPLEMRDVAVLKGIAYGKGGGPMACMGIAATDFDLNGTIDFHVTNFNDEWSNQYMQSADRVFTDLALPYGIDLVSNGMLGFGAQAIDYDNNSIPDLVIGNGHIEDFRSQGSLFQMPTQLLAGSGTSFQSLSVEGDDEYWKQRHLSRSLIKLDWNRDGRLDFAVTDLMESLVLMENQTDSLNHWLQLRLIGTESERDAIGATVTIQIGDRMQTEFVQTGDGYMAKNQPLIHFGLGNSNVVDRIEIRWPSGRTQHWANIAADQRLQIVEGQTATFSSTR